MFPKPSHKQEFIRVVVSLKLRAEDCFSFPHRPMTPASRLLLTCVQIYILNQPTYRRAMAGFLRRKNKQPATVNVVADTTTTTTTTKTKGATPPLFARFSTTATKSMDDVPRIVSSPMSLAPANRGGGGGGLEGGE